MIKIIKELLVNNSGKIIPQRIKKSYLIQNNIYEFIDKSYDTSYSLSEKVYCIINDYEKRPVCKICKTPLKFRHGYSTYCSRKCSNSDPEVLEKNKKGVSKSLKLAYKKEGEVIKQKRKQTLFKNYNVNVNSPFSIQEIKDKIYETNLKKYGVTNVFYLEEFRKNGGDKSRTNSIRLSHSKGHEIEYLDKGLIKIKNGCDIHGNIELDSVNFYNRYYRNRKGIKCPICNPISSYSSLEFIFENMIKQMGIKNYKKNTKSIINPYELDFYFPDYNLAIELNGVYWHSEIYKDKNYHKIKSDLCNNLGINLIHIWEDDLYNRQDIIKSMLKYHFHNIPNKIYARNCIIKNITSKVYRKFLHDNHLQGEINSSIRYGLFYENKLLSVMGFGKLRSSLGSKNTFKIYELQRFCNIIDYQVVGAASRLFNHFIKNNDFQQIISYAKRDHSQGNLYRKLQFKLDKICDPGYYWIIEGKRKHRYNYRKDRIANETNNHLTAVEIMHQNGVIRCFDSGNLKFKYEKDTNIPS